MAQRFNINIDEGATWNLDVQYLDENNDKIDISGYSARMQIRGRGDIVAELTTANGSIVIEDDTIKLTMSDAVTSTMSSVFMVYDLEIYTSAEVIRLIEGSVIVSPNVTKNE